MLMVSVLACECKSGFENGLENEGVLGYSGLEMNGIFGSSGPQYFRPKDRE